MTGLVWEGSVDLEKNLVPITSLVRHPRNPRRGKVALIGESLARFGQVRPVLTDGTNIIAGNHTYLAAVELGWTHIAAIRNDFTDEGEARAYLLADNRIPELGGYDNAQLLAQLEALEEADGWDGTGYGPDDLDDLRAVQGVIITTEQEEFQGDFAASAEELAAREALLASGRALSEVVLMFEAAQSVDFDAYIRILGKHYGGGGVTDTVFRAVADAHSREP